jgi:LAO/AO transport system kinase
VSATRPQDVPAGLLPLLAAFREGRQSALGRAITLVENEDVGFQELLHALLRDGGSTREPPPHAARVGPGACRVGVTGPPGAGKSTLLAVLAAAYRAQGERVGVVAVDPTSPFSGGALLGDRIRMNDLATDPGIFIRSMATRGSLGGLATTTREVLDLMDAFGFERVLVETVGVGQTELEITGAADTVVVVLVPESGDAIQAMKAGLMEIADVFVVNKADRPGADRLIKEIQTALHLRAGEVAWEIPVLRAVAQTGEGVGDLMDAVAAHRAWLEASGTLERRRRARAERRVRDVVERALRRRAWTDPSVQATLARGLDGIARGDETPYSVASAIVGRVLGEGRDA